MENDGMYRGPMKGPAWDAWCREHGLYNDDPEAPAESSVLTKEVHFSPKARDLPWAAYWRDTKTGMSTVKFFRYKAEAIAALEGAAPGADALWLYTDGA